MAVPPFSPIPNLQSEDIANSTMTSPEKKAQSPAPEAASPKGKQKSPTPGPATPAQAKSPTPGPASPVTAKSPTPGPASPGTTTAGLLSGAHWAEVVRI